MAQKYAKGSQAWGICGRSGRKMLLRDMVFDGRFPNMRVDPAWWEDKHPQESLPKVEDPTALYRPSPEVIAPPTAPVLTAAQNQSEQVLLTWTPAESAITEIASYTIYRNVSGGPFAPLVVCAVLRDFLGGITGIQNCTTTFPPANPTIYFPDDGPISYVDGSVTPGPAYCYYVTAQPMGNNQSVAQGPASPPSNTACITIATFFRLTEDGALRATESGDHRVLENAP